MTPSIPFGDQQPIVGREREQAQLRQLLDATTAGHGSLVLISGEAGIGKTTLVRDLIRQAEGQGMLVLSGGCYDLTTTPPYGPWSGAFSSYQPDGGQPPLPDWSQNPEALQEFGSQAALFEEVGRSVAGITDVLPLVIVLEDLHWSDPASLDLLRYLSHRTRALGMLVVSTFRNDEHTRQHPLIQHLSLIARETDAERLELQRLNTDAVRELVAQYGLDVGETERLVTYLEQRAAGNPFFTRELLRALESEGILQMDGAGARLGELDQGFLPSFVLQLIERRLARLEGESREALEIASVIGQEVSFDLWASVSGLQPSSLDPAIAQALELHVMAETTDRQGLGFTHALVRDVLYQGVLPTRRRAWHRQTGEVLVATNSPDPATVAHHFQQAGDERAIEWHLRAGIRTRRSAPFSAAVHFEQAAAMLGGDERRAREIGWLRYEAGSLLYSSGEPRSIEHMIAAERLGALAADPVLVAYACAARGQQRCARGDIRQGLKEFQQGVAANDALMDTHYLPDPGEMVAIVQRVLSGNDEGWGDQTAVRSDDGASQLRVNVWRTVLTNWLSQAGHYSEAVAIGEALLAEVAVAYGADHLNSASTRPRGLIGRPAGHLGLGYAYAALGRPADARREFAIVRESDSADGVYQLVELAIWSDLLLAVIPYQTDQLAERAGLVAEAKRAWVRCRGLTVVTAGDGAPSELQLDLLEGRWQKARDLAVAHLPAPWISRVHEAIMTLGIMARHQGEVDEAWEYVIRLLPHGPATEPGDSWFATAICTVGLAAELALDGGDLELAKAWIEAHERWLTWSTAALWQPHQHLLRARYQRLAGDLDDACQHATQALKCASDPRQPLALLAAHRLLGEIETQREQFTDAEEHLQQSLTLAIACVAPYEQARTKLAFAELWLATNKPEAATLLLDQAHEPCLALNAKPALDRIEELMARLADRAATPLDHPDGLTPREAEVLELIAAGRSNREIAEALFLSPRTIERHIANIYLKLEVHSKAEATAYARRQHLV